MRLIILALTAITCCTQTSNAVIRRGTERTPLLNTGHRFEPLHQPKKGFFSKINGILSSNSRKKRLSGEHEIASNAKQQKQLQLLRRFPWPASDDDGQTRHKKLINRAVLEDKQAARIFINVACSREDYTLGYENNPKSTLLKYRDLQQILDKNPDLHDHIMQDTPRKQTFMQLQRAAVAVGKNQIITED